MKLIDALVSVLKIWRTQYVFGVSGANIEHLHDAIYRAGDHAPKAIFAKSEIGAAYMANGYSKISKSLGVCCSTSGGGMMNLAVGVAESYAESIPILAIVGQIPLEMEGKGGFQDSSGKNGTIDALAYWNTITKCTEKIASSTDFWPKFKKVIENIFTDRPGPGALLIPRDLYDNRVDYIPPDFPTDLSKLKRELSGNNRKVTFRDQDSRHISLDFDHTSEQEILHRLIELIDTSKCPCLILGSGIHYEKDNTAVNQFLETTQLPFVTSWSCMVNYTDDKYNYLGKVGSAGHPSVHKFINEKVDLIISLGTGLSQATRFPIKDALMMKNLVVINKYKSSTYDLMDPLMSIYHPINKLFQKLNHLLDDAPLTPKIMSNYQKTVFEPIIANPINQKQSTEEILLQSESLKVINKYLPDKGVIVFDAGNCAAAALHYLDISCDISSLITLGMGTMGYSIGASIGVSLALGSNSYCVTILGDGAFYMMGLEIHTAVELQLPIIYIVINNGKHGMCVTRQQKFFENRIVCSTYNPSSIDDIAQSLTSGKEGNSIFTRACKTQNEIEQFFQDYSKHKIKVPALLEIIIEQEEIPPFIPIMNKYNEILHNNSEFV